MAHSYYAILVRTYNGGYGPWAGPVDFTIQGIPQQMALVSPAGIVAGTTTSIDYTWQTDNWAEYYELYVVKDGKKRYSHWYHTNDLVQAGGTTTVSKAGHAWDKYTWYVRGWSSDGYGEYSDGAEFTIGETQPVSPSGVQGGDVTQLRWDDTGAEGATWYQLWVNLNSGTKYWSSWIQVGDTTVAGDDRTTQVRVSAAPTNTLHLLADHRHPVNSNRFPIQDVG